MAYNINSLSDALKNYVDGSRIDILMDAVAGGDSIARMNLLTNVKSTTPLVVLDQDVELKDGKVCGFEAGSDANLTNRDIVPAYAKIQKEYCPETLLDTALNHEVLVGAGREKLPFEEKLIANLVAKTNKAVEKAVWAGAKPTDQIDGILTIVGQEVTAGTITPIQNSRTTVTDRLWDIYTNIPEELMGKGEVVMSVANYRTFIKEMNDAGTIQYNLNIEDNNAMTSVLPGTNMTVRAITGMGTSTDILYVIWDEIYFGTDMESDRANVKVWYSDDNQTFRTDLSFAYGVQIAFPSHIVYSKN